MDTPMSTELLLPSGSNVAESCDGRAITVLPTPGRIDLKTIDDVRECARVYRDMRANRIEMADGTKLVRGGSVS